MDAVLWPTYEVAVITLIEHSDEVRVKETLDRFAINWQMEKS
jgi:hypothetical protein